MNRTKAEYARAIVTTLRPTFEDTAKVILSIENCLGQMPEQTIADGIRDMVDGGSLGARNLKEPVSTEDWQRLQDAGFTETELTSHGFFVREKREDDCPGRICTSAIIAASREDIVEALQPALMRK
jgi:hypothetical protein